MYSFLICRLQQARWFLFTWLLCAPWHLGPLSLCLGYKQRCRRRGCGQSNTICGHGRCFERSGNRTRHHQSMPHSPSTFWWQSLHFRWCILIELYIQLYKSLSGLSGSFSDRAYNVAKPFSSDQFKRLCILLYRPWATRLSEAVHYAPHGHLDVQSISCDFLACSPYKFFGPHAGPHSICLVCSG